MAYLVCQRFSSGPKCSDNRKESTGPEKQDCIEDAIRRANRDYNNCVATQWSSLYQFTVSGADCASPGCLDELSCLEVNSFWKDNLMRCYCSGLSGLQCVLCDDFGNDLGDPNRDNGGTGYTPDRPPEDPSVIPDDTDRPTYSTPDPYQQGRMATTVTRSDYGIPIPRVFGRTALAGNIIQIENPHTLKTTKRVVVGNTTRTVTTETSTFDMLLGLTSTNIRAVRRIWFSDVLVYNAADDATDGERVGINVNYAGTNLQIHNGSESQKVIPALAIQQGFGKQPAYRGLTFLRADSFPTNVGGSSLPTIRVEVVTDIDPTFAAVTSSDLGYSADDSLFAVDPVGGRLALANGDGKLKIVNLENMSQVSEISVSGSIVPSSMIFTEDGDIVFQTTDNKLHFMAGHRQQVFSTTTPGVGKLAAFTMSTQNAESFPVIALAHENDLYIYSVDRVNATFTLDNSDLALTTNNIQFLLGGDTGWATPKIAYYAKEFFTITSEATGISMFRKPVAMSIAPYDPINTFEVAFGGALWGATDETSTMHDVLLNTYDNSIQVFAKDGTRKFVAGYLPYGRAIALGDYFGFKGYAQDVPALPAFNVARTKMSPFGDANYTFIAEDNNTIYALDTDTQQMTFVNTLTNVGAPALSGGQYWDGARAMLVYRDVNGDITRLRTNRIKAAKTTVAEIVRRLSLESGVPASAIDVSAVETFEMDGYIVADQTTVGQAYQELADFFQISIKESNGRIVATPLTTSSSVTMDANNSYGFARSKITDLTDVDSVSVSYYDTGLDSIVNQQTVSRDFFSDYDDFTSNVGTMTYTTAIFTDASSARKSAERFLLRTLQRQETTEIYAAPSRLAVEPGDFVGTYRVSATEIDVNFSVRVAAAYDDVSVYNYEADISGFARASGPIERRDAVGYVKEVPILIVAPPLSDIPSSAAVYVGLFNPDTATFVPRSAFIRGSDTDFRNIGTPAAEAIVGKLITPPAAVTAEFSTDRSSSMVVEFSKEVPSGVLENLTARDNLYTSYTKNALFIGREVIQYQNYSIAVDNKTVTFTNLFRGRFGTDQSIGTHVAGELCAVYDPTRLMLGSATADMTANGFVQAAVYDAGSPNISREVTGAVDYSVKEGWTLAELNIKKKRVGSGRGVQLSGMVRAPHRNSTFFGVEGEQLQDVTSQRMVAVIINGVFDQDTFETALVEAKFPLDTDAQPSPRSSYIIRAFPNVSEAVQDDTPGKLYREADMTVDGLTYDDDLTFVTFGVRTEVGTIVTPYKVVKFKADTLYETFREGRDG